MYNLYTRNVLALRRKVFRLWVTAAFSKIRQELFLASHMQIKSALKTFTCWRLFTAIRLQNPVSRTSPAQSFLSVLENRVMNLENIITRTAGYSQEHISRSDSSFLHESKSRPFTSCKALDSISPVRNSGDFIPVLPCWPATDRHVFDLPEVEVAPNLMNTNSSMAASLLNRGAALHQRGKALCASTITSPTCPPKQHCPSDSNPQQNPPTYQNDGASFEAHQSLAESNFPDRGKSRGSGRLDGKQSAASSAEGEEEHCLPVGEGESALFGWGAESADGGSACASVRDRHGSSERLPLGWRRRHSRKWGRIFYYHPDSGRSQWHPPGVEAGESDVAGAGAGA